MISKKKEDETVLINCIDLTVTYNKLGDIITNCYTKEVCSDR